MFLPCWFAGCDHRSLNGTLKQSRISEREARVSHTENGGRPKGGTDFLFEGPDSGCSSAKGQATSGWREAIEEEARPVEKIRHGAK